MAGEARTAVTFELWDGAAAETGESVLGLWAPAAELKDRTPVWRASYPADPDEAEAGLKKAHNKLAAAQAALAEAPDRLETFAARQAAGLQPQSFGLGAAAPEPESDLALLLLEMRQGQAPQGYAAAGESTGRWDQAVEAVEDLIKRLERSMSDYAWVETCVGGHLVAQTRIGWTGDAETVVLAPWPAGASQGGRPDPRLMALHRQTLALALASRQALMRTFTAALEAAVKLAASGGILALPAVWRFINQVRIEWQKRKEISNG